MNQNYQKEIFIALLQTAAEEYNKLLTIEIVLSSSFFINSKTYALRFYESNFLHLTGISTSLTAKDFFKKCLNKTISTEDLNDIRSANEKCTIKNKLFALQQLSQCFNQTINVQEDFIKNLISCTIATSDGVRTIGFIKAGLVNRPMTLLNKNKLDNSKPIIRIKPLVKKK